MAILLRASWLGTLSWLCICLLPQNGCNEYSPSNDEFRGYTGMHGPQTQHHQDYVDQMRAMRPLQREPVHQDNNVWDVGSDNLSEERLQHKPSSGHHESDKNVAAPSAKKHAYENSGYQHPFGLLMKENTGEKHVEGVSFPTIRDFKHFVEKMKGSYLLPGNYLSKHFQTARQVMENEMSLNAQNTGRELDADYRPNSAEEGAAHDGVSANEVWTEPLYTVHEQGANNQMPSEGLSVLDPVNSPASLISTGVYDNQDPALYPHHSLAAAEHALNNSVSFGKTADAFAFFTTATGERNEDFPSTIHALPEQTPSSSFFGEDLSFSNREAAPTQNIPSQDFSYYSSMTSQMTPLTPGENIQYAPQSDVSIPGHQEQSLGDSGLGEDFHSEEQVEVTATLKPSMGSYAKSIYVKAPRGQHYIPHYLPARRERPAKPIPNYQPTVVNKLNTPTVLKPVSRGAASSNLSPQRSTGHVDAETSSSHAAQDLTFSTRQPVTSHLAPTVKPPSTLYGSSTNGVHLEDQRGGDARPSTLTAEVKDEMNSEERSDVSKQNLVSVAQKPKQMTNDNMISVYGGLDSTQGVSFSSTANLVPAAETRVTSRVFAMENTLSDGLQDADTQSSFSTTQRSDMPQDDVDVTLTEAGQMQNFIQPVKLMKPPVNVNKRPGLIFYRPYKPLLMPKVTSSTFKNVFQRNRDSKWLPPQMSTAVKKTYVVQSRNNYVRRRASLSNTLYMPYQVGKEKTGWNQGFPKYNTDLNLKGYDEH